MTLWPLLGVMYIFLLNSLRYRIIFSRSQTILKEKLIIWFLPSTFYSDMAVRPEATAHFRQYLLYPGGDQPDWLREPGRQWLLHHANGVAGWAGDDLQGAAGEGGPALPKRGGGQYWVGIGELATATSSWFSCMCIFEKPVNHEIYLEVSFWYCVAWNNCTLLGWCQMSRIDPDLVRVLVRVLFLS